MKIIIRFLFLFAIAAAGLAVNLSAAEPAADDRMKAMLRDLTLQLRTAQSDLAAAQSAQAALAAEKKELADKYELLKKQASAERGTLDRTVINLTAQAGDLKGQVTKLSAALAEAKAEGDKSAQAARTTEEQRAKLATEMAQMQQRLADREQKNLALFLLGNEILTRYQEFSLGNALRAKEPFVGQTRTKLENLVQDYQDKLDDQRVKP
jgi:chromosome segregation ATPase